MMRLKDNFVPQKLYTQFLRKLPLCCVDVVLVHNKSFLLVRRKHAPAKGRWWLPGGRLLWREHPRAAVKRKLCEELGVTHVGRITFLGVGESRFDDGYFGAPYHSINLTFVAHIGDAVARRIQLDMANHTEYKWFQNVSSPIPAYVARFLRMAGFKQ
jgi:colanic acid biosynthesis protein WcaH